MNENRLRRRCCGPRPGGLPHDHGGAADRSRRKTPSSGVLTVSIPAIPVATPTPDAERRLPLRRPRRRRLPSHPDADSAAERRRLRQPAAAAVSRMNTKIHIRGAEHVDARLDAARRPRRRLLPQDRLHRRPALLPGPHGGHARSRRVRDLRGRHGEGHGPARPHVVPQRPALHRGGRRLREPRGQPVPAVRVQGRALQGLHRATGSAARSWPTGDAAHTGLDSRRGPV